MLDLFLSFFFLNSSKTYVQSLQNEFKGALSRVDIRRIQGCKNTFYSSGNLQINWSSFDKNYYAGVMKLKKCSIIVIPPGAQNPNLKKSARFF